MIHHERRLPHWDLVGEPLFVTFRLHGSLPAGRAFPPALLTDGKAFTVMDRFLDRAESGPRYLGMPEIAALMVACLRDGERRFHRLVTPSVVAAKWLGPLKGFAAHEANRILGRTGTFWQQESYDHVVRSDAGLERVRHYIENNPVKAGLAATAEDFRWSSAGGNGTAA